MNKYLVVLSLFMFSTCLNASSLSLFKDMTQGKSQLDVQMGEPAQINKSEKMCITAQCSQGNNGCKPTNEYSGSPLMASSDYEKYYGLTTSGDYSQYSADSMYAKDVETLTNDMDRLMESFKRTGLRKELKQHKLKPALMFDIDNTLEFSAAADSDPKGEGPAIKGMVNFVNRWCFKDGVECYFITARYCNVSSTTPTLKWLKANLNFTEDKLKRYTYFSSNPQNLSCNNLAQGQTVAYKDLIREALEKQEKVFWLMSVGDQLTDSLGEHSGMKIRVPNQFFHSDIVPNQDAPWGVGQCGSPMTLAPPRACSEQLLKHAIEYTNLNYCSTQPASSQ